MAPPGQPRTSQDEPRRELRDVSRVRISTDVAAPLGPAVAAAAKVPDVDSVRDGGSELPGPGLRDDL